MSTFLITFLVLGIAVLGMSVGLLRGKRIRGSCGGLNNEACVCDKPCARKRRALET
jgi:hypothetical protein